jgi:hypothetical protein
VILSAIALNLTGIVVDKLARRVIMLSFFGVRWFYSEGLRKNKTLTGC